MPRNIVPTAIKKAKGTLNVTRALTSEMKVEASNLIPDAPDSLDEVGANQWRLMCLEFMRNGILANIDHNQILTYCHAVSIFHRAAKVINEEGPIGLNGNGIETVSNWWKVYMDSVSTMHKVGPTLGITPAARTKISSDKSKAVNPVSQLLKKTAV